MIFGLDPAYSVDGETDVTKWYYYNMRVELKRNLKANGFRLPTLAEWQYAAKAGEDFNYAGSNNIDEVAWYEGNSNDKTYEVGKKKANGYGLYDMCGNVWEWCWDVYRYNSDFRYIRGGSWKPTRCLML